METSEFPAGTAPFTVAWTFFLRVASERAADAVLRRFAKAIGRRVDLVHRERYWKDPSLMRVEAVTPLGTHQVAEAVFDVLRMGRGVDSSWHVLGLSSYADDKWEFRVEATARGSGSTSIPGVVVVLGTVQNFCQESADGDSF